MLDNLKGVFFKGAVNECREQGEIEVKIELNNGGNIKMENFLNKKN